MNKKKVIMVIAADGGYQKVAQAARDTWASSKLDDFEIFFYYGYRENPGPAPGQCIRCNDELYCGVEPNDTHTRSEIAFNYIYDNYDFDYLFQGACTRYYVQQKMVEFLKDKPTDRFLTGGGIFLSKDLVKILVEDPFGLNRSLAHDLALVTYFIEKGIKIVNSPQQFINVSLKNIID
jgi:hypothetical protein